jgi:hypothetical protein
MASGDESFCIVGDLTLGQLLDEESEYLSRFDVSAQ